MANKLADKTRPRYVPAIGIECHVQLNTQTKLFSASDNDARGAKPNTLISHIDLGMPGALPVLNEKAVEHAIRMAFAFHTRPQTSSYFERKHYFYPDLPKGYQITQLHAPIIKGGYVEINVGGKPRKINLDRVQLEEDAGKSLHEKGKDYSLVDLNRAGTPLLEIVSQPEMTTPQEAKAYARELYLLARYAGVSDADLYHGNMRFDVNVSLSAEPGKLGTRTETKNLNSFRSVERAVEYEIKRQAEILDRGGEIIQETRGWDEAKQKTVAQRGKEEAHDYRYFPEPDVPPLELDEDQIETIGGQLPVMPDEWRRRLAQLGLDDSQTETLIETEMETDGIRRLPILEKNLDRPELAKSLANWMVNIEVPLQRDDKIESILSAEDKSRLYADVYELVKAGKLSSTNAKALLSTLITRGIAPDQIGKYAEEQGFIQETDEAAIARIVDKVIADNSKAADDVRNGEMKAIGFLVGQVMKASLGKADPKLAQELVKQRLDI